MQLLPALLPFITFLCLFILLGNRYTFDQTRQVLIYTALLIGAYLVALTEFLSLWNGITPAGLAVGWLAPDLAIAVWFWKQIKSGKKLLLPRFHFPRAWTDWILFFVVVTILGITVFIAWFVPPQTPDAFSYHMSRVAHWAQDASLRHFATGISRQVSITPGAEMEVLNLYVLAQGDRLANFPQWLSMLGSLAAVSLAAYYLGAKSNGQWIAALFAAALPIGIVEASSASTDYVTGFWVLCAALESLEYYKTQRPRALFFLSLAAGLAILTKPIAVPFLIPFGVWAGFILLRQAGIFGAIKWGTTAVLIILLLNSGYLARNWITYGSPFRTMDVVQHNNELHTLPGVTSILLRNAGFQAGLSNMAQWNKNLFRAILAAHVLMGLDINDPRTTNIGEFRIDPPSTSEDMVTNPYHAYLILGCFILAFVVRKRIGNLALIYSLLAAATFVVFSFIFKWNIFGGRYLLPFFVLYAPAAGVILGSLDQFKFGSFVAILLFVCAFPWLFSIDSRPIISQAKHSTIDSILKVPREELYFANEPDLYKSYLYIANDIKARNCNQVGIMLGGDDSEYWIWQMLGAPRPDLTIDWIVNGPTERYRLPGFEPCALICKGCSADETTFGNLKYAYKMGSLNLKLYFLPDK
jgi:hypothetical protein